MRPTVWLSGGRRGGTCVAHQVNYRAAPLRAAADRPSAGAGVRRLYALRVAKTSNAKT